MCLSLRITEYVIARHFAEAISAFEGLIAQKLEIPLLRC